MPDISSIGHGSFEPLSRPSAPSSSVHRNGTTSSHGRGDRETDRVELSDHARFLDRIREMPTGRLNLVEHVKQAIASGEYESDDKLHYAISQLIEELDT